MILHWFRRDLRVHGNPALARACEIAASRSEPVYGLVCVDPELLARQDIAESRFLFYLNALHELRENLRKQGSDLLIVEGNPESEIPALALRLGANTLTFNRDYEPYARSRDSRVEERLGSSGVEVITEADHQLLEPREVLKSDGTPYQVFTPYSRAWLGKLKEPAVQARIKNQLRGMPHFGFQKTNRATLLNPMPGGDDRLEHYREKFRRRVTIPIPPAGETAALARIHEFKSRMKEYENARNFPALRGTSQISPDLKNGSITVARLVGELELDSGDPGSAKYLSELIWREFSVSILWHFPTTESQEFIPKFRGIRWENREDFFQAWREGRTGFPIVDAGMRELLATGNMHNRVRMIVASFLIKDLLIDWRWGALHFMRHLLDGDLAPNTMGWQWAASTGVDPQPYFRIFNPTLQAERWDKDQKYIRRWIPEFGTPEYAAPIVEHGARSRQAIAVYKTAGVNARS